MQFSSIHKTRETSEKHTIKELSKAQFGEKFSWGTATSAYQIEGAWKADGKGRSIWDEFCNRKNKIINAETGQTSCDFYNLWEQDLNLLRYLGVDNYRFSLSWPRILPNGIRQVNQKGIDFYNKIIDKCLELDITPWVTLYHWDLPLELELKGGWTNREIIDWFREYTSVCAQEFGDRVKNWMVLNEPMVFTGTGYFLGIHAPGKKGLKNFIPAIHHAAMCQSLGGRILRDLVPDANIGTTFSCSHIDPFRLNSKDQIAAKKVDALLNRLFIEPALGMGYPLEDLKPLTRIEKYLRSNDELDLQFEFDFIGVQNYTRQVVKHSYFTPLIYADTVDPKKRNVNTTTMNWEIYPESMYHILKKFNDYPNVKNIVITENGAAFKDVVESGKVDDTERKHYLKTHLVEVLRAQKEGVPISGYFIWSFLDNFEWAEGYSQRFGIVHVDFNTQRRIIKDSGYWYKRFLKT